MTLHTVVAAKHTARHRAAKIPKGIFPRLETAAGATREIKDSVAQYRSLHSQTVCSSDLFGGGASGQV